MAEVDRVQFTSYVEQLAGVIGHADRVGPLHRYCLGLMLPVPRKSVEPLAAALAPSRVAAEHQSLLHFVGKSPWDDARVLAKVRDLVLPTIEAHGPIEVWVLDDTGIPKQGRHSVGVAHQHCGQLGKPANCQVSVSLSVANAWASLPVAWRLYLPKGWAGDQTRRQAAGVPASLAFATKPQIALEQIRQAVAAGVPPGVVVMDGGYGWDARLRGGIAGLGLDYAAAAPSATLVFVPGFAPPPGHKRRVNSNRQRHVASVEEVARALPPEAWQMVEWREGSAGPLRSRFARVRIHSADGHATGPRRPEWLMAEWPHGAPQPTRYWLSSLPEATGFARLVELAKMRWRIERDYHDLKQEVGLAHFEGRGWRGLHHHATLCIAAYGFLISQRNAVPPSGTRRTGPGAAPALPARAGPGQPTSTSRAAHAQLHPDNAPPSHHRTRQKPATMPLLPAASRTNITKPIVTQ